MDFTIQVKDVGYVCIYMHISILIYVIHMQYLCLCGSYIYIYKINI